MSINRAGKKYIVSSIVMAVIQLAILFIAAGKLNIIRYIVFSAIHLIYTFIALIVLSILNPELINHRGKQHENAQKWDTLIVKMVNINMIFVLPIIIGLDYRYSWLNLENILQLLGYILYLLSNVLVLSSMLVNQHFEPHVRLQSDRAHILVKRWPYSIIRHPGYTGVIFWVVGVPMILGSLTGLLFSLVIIAGLTIRTYLEDNFLSKKLEGYTQYKSEVKYRLFPGIW